jgi:vancomycin resistance protein YoaR
MTFNHKINFPLLVKGGVGVGLIFLAFSLPLVIGFGKTGKNTSVLGKDYSLLSKKQIISRLETDFPLPQTITLNNSDQKFSFDLSSISARLDTDQLASDMLFRRLHQGLINYFKAFFRPIDFPLEIKYRSDNLDQGLNQIAAQIDRPFVPSELALDPKTNYVIVKNGQLGLKTDINSLLQSLLSSLKYYELSSPIDIPVSSVGSLPQDSEIATVKTRAENLVGKSLSLTAPDQSISLPDSTLISWLDFSSSCRLDSIQNYVDGLTNNLKKDPIGAVFKFENNKVLEFRPDQNGYIIKPDGLSQLICSQLTGLIQNKDKTATLTLPVTILESKIKTADVNNLGIKDLLGTGKSTFHHSTDIRNYNVAKGASIVNRVLVAPGDTFSFIKALGDVTIAEGYKQAYVIKQGHTILDVGGGICQVSTTLFRAMLNAGLDITARTNHAYRVQYYEEDMPPGYDATVFIPSPDLKFINDTGHYVLIQSTYDDKNRSLMYQIYGTSDGRKVDISNYHQWGSTPPPPDIYIDDPTLPAGKVVQDEHRIPGLKTSFDWKVTRNGEVIHQKTFQSTFVPWAAVYRRGPTP